MGNFYPVRNSAGQALGQCGDPKHPGLLLDVYVPYDAQFNQFNQEQQQRHLTAIASAMTTHGGVAQALLAEWDDLVAALGANSWSWCMSTVWRLAAHLARPNALENASLCLHPVYGFPYLPGSGLKGLAQAYAHRIGADAGMMQAVFGDSSAGGGQVIFLDAWPKQWPEVEVDITNSHHKDYYGGRGTTPPGDWESPNPVYFLTVAPNVTFRFAVAKARPKVDNNVVDKAKEWLEKALQELGFGAKTAAGYGYFAPCDCATANTAPQTAAQSNVPIAQDPIDMVRQKTESWIESDADPGKLNQITGLFNKIPAEQRSDAVEEVIKILGQKRSDVLEHIFKKSGKSVRKVLEELRG